MITNADITKLKGVFATKEELAVVRDELGDVKVELGELKDKVDQVDTKVDTILNRLDGIAHGINTLKIENAAGTAHLARHDEQIAALAKHVDFKLPV